MFLQEEQVELDEILAKRNKRGKQTEEKPMEEKILVHSECHLDHTGSILTVPQQGTHRTGKTGKMAKKNPCQGKHREFGNFAKTQGKHREFCLGKL